MGSQHAPTAPAVRAQDLVKVYTRGGERVEALRGVSFSVPLGQRVALLGKSGSGKSTLLNLLGGLDHATSGELEVAGMPLNRATHRDLAEFRLRSIGIIFQSFNLIPSRTALQNVELPQVLAGQPPAERRRRAREALQAVGLEARLGHRPSELSGGEQQRVAIARAMVNRPRVLLADEPTGNLDTHTAAEIVELLQGLHRDGVTILLVTHDRELAEQFADRVLRLRDGHLESDWERPDADD